MRRARSRVGALLRVEKVDLSQFCEMARKRAIVFLSFYSGVKFARLRVDEKISSDKGHGKSTICLILSEFYSHLKTSKTLSLLSKQHRRVGYAQFFFSLQNCSLSLTRIQASFTHYSKSEQPNSFCLFSSCLVVIFSGLIFKARTQNSLVNNSFSLIFTPPSPRTFPKLLGLPNSPRGQNFPIEKDATNNKQSFSHASFNNIESRFAIRLKAFAAFLSCCKFPNGIASKNRSDGKLLGNVGSVSLGSRQSTVSKTVLGI